MENKAFQGQIQSRRQPLSDATTRVNNAQKSAHSGQHNNASLIPQLPHHESLKPDGNLQAINGSPSAAKESPPKFVENKRLSAITKDSQTPSNRDSQISTTSTASGGKSKRKTHVGPWQLGKTLGKGATGRVRLAKHALTEQTAAVKIVSKKSAALVQSASMVNMDDTLMASGTGNGRLMPFGIEREVVIMKLIEHPNIINLYDVWENRGELYLVLEYVEGGELFNHVVNNGPLPEEEAVRLFRQIIAGLSYCHRFNICHRDLKPENILLDRHHNVKIADFGMAALQPAGHWLNTSCGSPHYASPEIIHGKRYQGDKADIWSCGIILYVLLVGALPFDGGQDLQKTLRLVKKGEYTIPAIVTPEASNLIQRILRKRPEDRIPMADVWKHPLLKKYEILHQISSPFGTYVGPPPPLTAEEAGKVATKKSDIDPELLRNLHVLWHGEKQETLVERLLSEEPNYEKLFYNALIRFRNEQLENYPGTALDYSASDYHHVSPPIPKSVTLRQLQTQARNHSRRRSQFSILSEDTLRTKDKPYRPPSSAHTVESYDPFRSSRQQMINATAGHANVTILRHASDASRGRPRNPAIDRLLSEDASPESDYNSSKRNSVKSVTSKSSIASSRRSIGTSQPRRSTSYKRQVVFQHHRRSSAHPARHSNPLPAAASSNLAEKPNPSKPAPTDDVNLSSERFSSPDLSTPPATIRSRKPMSTGSHGEVFGPRPRPSSLYWKDDARKVSSELEKFCDQAFNRSNVGAQTGQTGQGTGQSKVPPKSVLRQASTINPNAQSRPLPLPPTNELESYTARTLAETREKLMDASAARGEEGLPDYLSNVINHLDRLLYSELNDKSGSKRTSSDPNPRSAGDPGYLPPITEEGLSPSQSNPNWTLRRGKDPARVVSEPASKQPASRSSDRRDCDTIRIVPPEVPNVVVEPIAPLNIRKASDAPLVPPQNQGHSTFNRGMRRMASGYTRDESAGPYFGDPEARDSGFIRYYPLVPIQEEDGSPKRKSTLRQSGDSKKWSIFKRNTQCSDELPPPIPSKDGQALHASRTRVSTGSSNDGKRNSTADSESSSRISDKEPGRKHKFLRFFTKAREADRGLQISNAEEEGGESDVRTVASTAQLGRCTSLAQHSSRQPPRTIQVNQNWFARFFNIKPATRILSLNVSKIRARREIVRVLRDWKRFGMKDIHVDRIRSLAFAKVDQDNYLRLRPVSFAAELFTVVEYGRRVNLSLVRFTQEKGAASSFNKVVDTLQEVLAKRQILVENRTRAKKMAKLLQ